MQRSNVSSSSKLLVLITALLLLISFAGVIVSHEALFKIEYYFVVKFVKAITCFSVLFYWHFIRQGRSLENQDSWFLKWQIGAFLLIQGFDGVLCLLLNNSDFHILTTVNLVFTSLLVFSLYKSFLSKRTADFVVIFLLSATFMGLIGYSLNGNINVVAIQLLNTSQLILALSSAVLILTISILRAQSSNGWASQFDIIPVTLTLGSLLEFIGKQEYWLWWSSTAFQMLFVLGLIIAVVYINRISSMDWNMLRAGLESAKHPYFYSDMTGNVRFVNKAYKILFELSDDIAFSKIKYPLYTHPLQDSISQELRKNRSWQGETVLISRSGKVIPVYANFSITYHNGIEYQQGWFEDIREKKLFKKNEHVMLEKLEHLSFNLMEKQEEERRFFAKELHDEIGQGLTLVKIQQQLPEPDKELIKTVLSELIDKVRNLSLNLRPAILDDMGLSSALTWLVDRQQKFTKIAISADIQEDIPRFDSKLEIAVFRITQEAFTNIHKYSHADHVSIKCVINDHELVLSISDNGVGFDIDAKLSRANQSQSLGLLSIKERAFLINGVVEIESTPESGTHIILKAPLSTHNIEDLAVEDENLEGETRDV